MVKKMTALVLLFGVIFLLAACGSETTSGDTDDSEVRTVEVTVPPTSKNLSWQTPDGEILGYEPDVLRAIDEKLEDYNFNILAVSDSAQETGLKTGKYDVAVGGYYKTPEREEQFLIPSEPTGMSLIKIYVREDSDIEEMKDLVGKNMVPTTAGGGTHNVIMEWQEENPEYNLEVTSSSGDIPYSERLQSVEGGQFDALILPSNLGQNEVIEELDLNIRETDPIKTGETVMLIHNSEENEQLAEDINNALKELRDEGTLSEISNEYYGEDIFQYAE
ncbi:transporter substrate-binding domain-containing protein [Virgibacillus byunsanensis]|uniref:Transporter substrate-binding domain-containing protein n=1 Tax=Virgibacillus byunsanensis TaxID=570945 RepID=A0ABW3LT19_9BACI